MIDLIYSVKRPYLDDEKSIIDLYSEPASLIESPDSTAEFLTTSGSLDKPYLVSNFRLMEVEPASSLIDLPLTSYTTKKPGTFEETPMRREPIPEIGFNWYPKRRPEGVKGEIGRPSMFLDLDWSIPVYDYNFPIYRDTHDYIFPVFKDTYNYSFPRFSIDGIFYSSGLPERGLYFTTIQEPEEACSEEPLILQSSRIDNISWKVEGDYVKFSTSDDTADIWLDVDVLNIANYAKVDVTLRDGEEKFKRSIWVQCESGLIFVLHGWNPITTNAHILLTNNHLTAYRYTGNQQDGYYRYYVGTYTGIGKSTGKWYWEVTYDTEGDRTPYMSTGIATVDYNLNHSLGNDTHYSWGFSVYAGYLSVNARGNSYYDSAISTGSIIGHAIDIDNNQLWYSVDGVWSDDEMANFNGDPENGTDSAFEIYSEENRGDFSGTIVYPALSLTRYSRGTLNLGETAFNTEPPTGFTALYGS